MLVATKFTGYLLGDDQSSEENKIMNSLMRNLENVLDKASLHRIDSRELKTLMNTYRTLLQRVSSDGLLEDHLKRFDEQKETLKSTLSWVEYRINDKLNKNEYKAADDYAEVTYRISKALIDINSILRYRTSHRDYESIVEDLVIKNGKVSLSQIPIKFERVRIIDPMVNWYEVSDKYDIEENMYYIDYVFGDVYFHKGNEGKTLRLAYYGQGGELKINDYKTK